MAQPVGRVLNARTGETVAHQIESADNPWRSFKGLMLRKELPDGNGMIFRPARGIHTCFMRFPIDLIYLDKSDRVVKIRPAMAPWRLDFTNADAVIEMPAGSAAQADLKPGDTLLFG